MKKLVGLSIALLFLLSMAVAEETKYTNDSFARLSHLTGYVFLQKAADLGYEEAVLNTPIAEGDRLGTTEGRAEIYLARKNYIRLDNNTKIDFQNLPDRGSGLTRIRIWAGNVYFSINFLDKEKNIEIHTADASLYVLDKGLYRVDVEENGKTEVFVFDGLVEAAAEEGSLLLKDSQRLEIQEGRFVSRPSRFAAVAEDSFDRWSEDRESKVRQQLAQRYLPGELEDFEYELDEYGDWVYLPPYGYVWVPGGVDTFWRPYFHGRWYWMHHWGWTWLPYEPWGWCTFHFGRWHWAVGLGWYWIPTTIWGPAWVSWWWDYDYYAWAPLGYYGYPVVVIDNHFYDHYNGYYPWNSRALTVIHKDQLKAPNVSKVALSQDSLKSVGKFSLSSEGLSLKSLKPEAGQVRGESLEGRRFIPKKEQSSVGPQQERRIEKSSIRRPETLSAPKTEGKTVEGQSSKPSQERKIRKKETSSDSPSFESRSSIRRDSFGYPSSPEISRRKFSTEKESSRSSSFINRIYKYISGGSSSRISSRDSTSRGSISSRSGSSSRTSSQGSSSRSSGGARSGSLKKKD